MKMFWKKKEKKQAHRVAIDSKTKGNIPSFTKIPEIVNNFLKISQFDFGILSDIPRDIIRFNILLYFNVKEIARLSRTNKSFLCLTESDSFWETLFKQEHGEFENPQKLPWKQLYYENDNKWIIVCSHCQLSLDKKTVWTEDSGAWYCAGFPVKGTGIKEFTFKGIKSPGKTHYSANVMFGLVYEGSFNFDGYYYPGSGGGNISKNRETTVLSHHIPKSIGFWDPFPENSWRKVFIDMDKKEIWFSRSETDSDYVLTQKETFCDFPKDKTPILITSILSGSAVRILVGGELNENIKPKE